MAMPVIVPSQSFLNTADLEWSVVLSCPGDCPPSGIFGARLKKDLASIDPKLVFSEERGTLVRGTPNLVDETIPITFKASHAAVFGFLGDHTFDLYYLKSGGVLPVMRTTFKFEAGA